MLTRSALRLAEKPEDARKEPVKAEVEIPRPGEVSREEIDEIDILRRIVLEVTEPEPMSFTTT